MPRSPEDLARTGVGSFAPRALATRASTLVALFVLCRSATAWASPSDLFGSGARSIGRAGTGVATGSGPSATRANPALLAGDGEPTLRLGYRAAAFELRGQSEDSAFDLGDGSAAIGFGARLPLTLARPLEGRLALGVDFNSPGAGIARVRILAPERPQFPLLATRAEALDLTVGLGVLLPASLRVGGGVMVQSSVAGTVELQAGASSAVQSHVDDELYVVTAPVVGAAWLGEAVSLGFAYRGELKSEFDLHVTLEDLGRLALPPLSVTGLAQYDPSQFHAELAARAASYELTMGLGYKRWSNIERLKGPTVVCPAEAEDCAQPVEPSLGFEDTWVPRLAVARDFHPTSGTRLAVSLGYFYEPTPLPAQHTDTNLWDNPRHAVTLGTELRADAGFAVALGVQRHFLRTRRHEKSEATQSPFPWVETSGSIWVSSVDFEVAF